MLTELSEFLNQKQKYAYFNIINVSQYIWLGKNQFYKVWLL